MLDDVPVVPKVPDVLLVVSVDGVPAVVEDDDGIVGLDDRVDELLVELVSVELMPALLAAGSDDVEEEGLAAVELELLGLW